MAKNLEELEDLVYIWAKDKGIIDAKDILAQANKLSEEAIECLIEVENMKDSFKKHKDMADVAEYREKARMELGDVIVVAVILSNMLQSDIFTCLNMAYNKINKRKGRMEGGVFVKDE